MSTLKTSSQDLNVPAKVMPATVNTLVATDYWEHDDNLGDKWWEGGDNPQPYRWEITVTLVPVEHGSHLTRTPYRFNGLDVIVGDYIAGSTDGKAVQIVSILEKTDTQVRCIVEDVLRYNTFRNPSGVGIFTVPGQVVIFQLNEFGEPMIDPLPIGVVSEDFYPNVNSRFKYLNLRSHFVLDKENHGFQEGDVIAISDDGVFELSDSSNLDKLIGTVSHAGPGPNKFMLRPLNGLIDFVPTLPGNAGDFIYASSDGSGDLTVNNSGAPIFLNIRAAIPSTVLGEVENATTSAGNVIEINDVQVTMSGTTLATAANDINLLESSHGVIASVIPSPTTAFSDNVSYTSAYGLVGGYAPFSASFNGTVVNFTTTSAGQSTYNQPVAIAEDMAYDINNANIPNIDAKAIDNKLYIYERTGSALTIANVTNDTNNNPFAGSGSIASVGLSYAATTSENLLLTRSNGGEILLRNISGTSLEDFGIVSGHNGHYPIGLNVEQGIRTTHIVVVANIPARDALDNLLVGDQAYVIDAGEGEWGMYLWDGTNWVVIATQDSAATDANSLSHTFTMPLNTGNDLDTVLMGRISDNSRVVSVLVEVIEPLTGGTSTPEFNCGTAAQFDILANDEWFDLELQGSYAVTPDFHYAGATELELFSTLSHYGATAGEIKVTISYV